VSDDIEEPDDELASEQEQLDAVRELRRGFDLAIRLFEKGDEQSRQASFALLDKLWPVPERSIEQEDVAERIEGMSMGEALDEIFQAMNDGELTLDEAHELAQGLEP
jgi:hypothetical protein